MSDFRYAVKFPAGTILTCPACGDPIATARRDILRTDAMVLSAWQWHQARSVCPAPICRACGSPYVRDSFYGRKLAHTAEGWR